jgi:hypothetical protein
MVGAARFCVGHGGPARERSSAIRRTSPAAVMKAISVMAKWWQSFKGAGSFKSV